MGDDCTARKTNIHTFNARGLPHTEWATMELGFPGPTRAKHTAESREKRHEVWNFYELQLPRPWEAATNSGLPGTR